jgi:hypothetical protein
MRYYGECFKDLLPIDHTFALLLSIIPDST